MLAGILGNLAFLFGGRARQDLEANPTAPTLPAQLTVARGQTVLGIRGGLSGLSGSETDYAEDQHTPDLLLQDLSAHALPPSMFRAQGVLDAPNDPAYYRGPVDLRRPRWGNQVRGVPRLVSATLLPPTSRTPRAEVMQAARNQARPDLARLSDVFESED